MRHDGVKFFLIGASSEEMEEATYQLQQEIAKAKFMLPLERPDHGPMQVRSERELEVGTRYRFHNKLSSTVHMYDGPDKDPRFFRVLSSRGNSRCESYADCGLRPYDLGTWNDTNWIERLS